MRTVVWIGIAVVWIVIIGFIGYSYFRAPTKNEFSAVKNFISASQQHVSGKQIDLSTLEGNDTNAEYVKIFANYLNHLLEINNRLSTVKNNLYSLAQPRTIVTAPSIYELQERQNSFDKEVYSIRSDLETQILKAIEQMNTLDKTKIKVFDPSSFADSLNQGKPERDKEIGQYLGLSQYIKTLLEFASSRKGMFQMGTDGALHFTTPTDQEYYNTLITGINQYVKTIDDYREQKNKEDRKLVNDMSTR